MRLNAPTQAMWLVAVIVGGLGLLARYVRIQPLSQYSFELLALGFIVLVVATLIRRA